jgi:NADPH:quinone reductase-like Zn-dependent oxidoreductase
MAAVQIAKRVGATIIATAGSDDKLVKARELGAHHTINYREADVRAEVMELTGKRGVDLVFEHVGGEMWDAIVRCVTRNGRIVTCGGTAGYEVGMNIAHVFHKQLTIIGSNSATKWELLQLTPFLLDGTFAPVVDRVFRLEQAAEAHEYLADRRQFGKVVLDVDA